MKLSQLSGEPSPDFDKIEISELCFDSREVKPGSVFFAIRGHAQDGHEHLAQVIAKIPAAIVVEDENKVPSHFRGPIFKVKNSRQCLDLWSSRFFESPGEGLFCVGVTGTNGKTTTVYMLEAILGVCGWPTGVLGTIDHHFGAKKWESSLTTPDPIVLQSRLREFCKLGARAAAFEVSSIATDQDRISSVPFDAAIFTNFTRDHLDYHGSMENYFASKLKLFNQILPHSSKDNIFAVINGDDPEIRKIAIKDKVRRVSFGQRECDHVFKILESSLSGTRFEVNGKHIVHLATPGLHNVYNAMGALVVALEKGCEVEAVTRALAQFHGAPGRLEAIPNQRGLHIFVDYAHTDDALHSVAASLKKLMRSTEVKGDLWTVFGCGGDRDRGKRPLMMKAAIGNSDRVVLTSDNPRTENPQSIINDCLQGSHAKKNVHVESDRKKAIAFALQTAKEGDVILIAGKGHENYQIIGQTKFPFSDVEVVKEILR
jgi:UDP-N-acetylmuramoyl-L-alanyl-D-glutamate--2,6-diaminopimelate ligase